MTNHDTPPTEPRGPDCLLTLALPQAIEEEMLDLLHDNAALAPGFTVLHGQGIGAGASLHSVMEQVQGRARRVLIHVVMRACDVEALLANIRASIRSAELFYWVAPLLGGGKLE